MFDESRRVRCSITLMSGLSALSVFVADSAFGVAAADHEKVSGALGNWLRLPFGLFALAAGWLADRFGAKRLLLVYLFGCSMAALLAWYSPSLLLVTVSSLPLPVLL